MRIKHIYGIDYVLTVTTTHNKQGIDRSTIDVKDLTGKAFDKWQRRYKLWRHPIHGIARSLAEIKEIYNAMDIDTYIRENSDES